MVIPGLQDETSPFRDHTQDTRKFEGIEAITLSNGDLGLKPDFGISAAAFDVNMSRLAWQPFVREKEKRKPLSRKITGILRPEPA
jgi:hypothetical protein